MIDVAMPRPEYSIATPVGGSHEPRRFSSIDRGYFETPDRNAQDGNSFESGINACVHSPNEPKHRSIRRMFAVAALPTDAEGFGLVAGRADDGPRSKRHQAWRGQDMFRRIGLDRLRPISEAAQTPRR